MATTTRQHMTHATPIVIGNTRCIHVSSLHMCCIVQVRDHKEIDTRSPKRGCPPGHLDIPPVEVGSRPDSIVSVLYDKAFSFRAGLDIFVPQPRPLVLCAAPRCSEHCFRRRSTRQQYGERGALQRCRSIVGRVTCFLLSSFKARC